MPTTSAPPKIQYDWTRFWIEPTAILDLSDAGFLADPEGRYAHDTALRPLSKLQSFRALVLLGEPGLGKSSELRHEHARMALLSAAEGLESLHIDLKSRSSEEGFFRQIFQAPQLLKWKDGNGHLVLHLDSLDEAMLRVETIAAWLAEELPSLPTDRLSIRITCRTVAWPDRTLRPVFEELWGKDAVGVFEMAPLRRRDVLAALTEHKIEHQPFIKDLFAAHAVPFAIKPLTLDMLIKIRLREGALPSSAAELYQKGCLALAEELNDNRRETRRLGRLNPDQRLRLASRIAAGTLLTAETTIWTGPLVDCPPEAVPLSRFSGAVERGDFPEFTASDDDVWEVLDTGLFNSRGPHSMGWAHQSYGEFLAPLYLKDKGVPSATILKVLTHPTGGLIPQLAVVGAWAAAAIPEIRRSLIELDPWALLRGDLAGWDEADIALLTRALLDHVEAGRDYDHFIGLTETYSKLKHPGLTEHLRTIITSPGLKITTRKLALTIAERCGLKSLQADILATALSQNDHPYVRAAAVSALASCADKTVLPDLLPLAAGTAGPDPQQEIMGNALELLWPGHITSAQLFPMLTSPDESFVGAYAMFTHNLPEQLQPSDLAPALDWATTFIRRVGHMGEFRFKNLADAIMMQAWEVFEDATLTSLFIDHIEARLHQFGELCKGSDHEASKAFQAKIKADPTRRQLYLRERLQRPLLDTEAWHLRRTDFLRPEDLPWLLSMSPAGPTPLPELDETSLCNAIAALFSIDDDAAFEAIFETAKHWPKLANHYAWLLEGVRLDSDAAAQARSQRDSFRRLEEMNKAEPAPKLDLTALILEGLDRSDAGEWPIWAELTRVLGLTPEGHRYVNHFDYLITDMPGWQNSDKRVRARIVTTAETYLSMAACQAETWIGTQPLSPKLVDVAAVRALLLLRQERGEIYHALPKPVWEKWAPAIAGLPRLAVQSDCPDIHAVTADALAQAPVAFVGGVVAMIRRDKAYARSASELPNPAFRFHFLQDLEGCWSHDGLKAAVLAEMLGVDVTPTEYAKLLGTLLRAGYEPALEHAAAGLADLEDGLEAAQVLLEHAPVRAWPALWAAMTRDDAFARALLQHATDRFYISEPFYAGIGEEAIADFYLLMERLFPAEDDARQANGSVHPFDPIPSLRDGGPRLLVNMGTEAAVRALRRLVVTKPDSHFLHFELSRAERTMRLKTWSPMTMREVFALTARPDKPLVTSGADLLNLLVEVLGQYDAFLHGAQSPRQRLWHQQGTQDLYRPVDENTFSDEIVLYLRERLANAGIFSNREVEVSRHPRAPVGERMDILINTMRLSETGEPIDPIAAVIEVKGSWNRELYTSLDAQLVRTYMVEFLAPVGIYLVAAFDTEKWDPADHRRRKALVASPSTVRHDLEGQAAAIPDDFMVRALVMEIAAP